MKDKVFYTISFLLILLFIVLYSDRNSYEESIQDDYNLRIGQTVPAIELKDIDGNKLELFSLLTGKNTGIFILPKPCLQCNPNFYFLKKLAQTYKHELTPICIINSNYQLNKKNFLDVDRAINVYYPADPAVFIKLMRMEFNPAKVHLLKGNKVVYSKTGDLDTTDYFNIIKILKGDKK
jgi:hypothetical protein